VIAASVDVTVGMRFGEAKQAVEAERSAEPGGADEMRTRRTANDWEAEAQVLQLEMEKTGAGSAVAANVVPDTPESPWWLEPLVTPRAGDSGKKKEDGNGVMSDAPPEEHLKNVNGFWDRGHRWWMVGWKVQYEQKRKKGHDGYFTPISLERTRGPLRLQCVNPAAKAGGTIDGPFYTFSGRSRLRWKIPEVTLRCSTSEQSDGALEGQKGRGVHLGESARVLCGGGGPPYLGRLVYPLPPPRER